MARKGLTKNIIVKTAADLIEKKGTPNFSMRILANVLNIKTASLYNHVESMHSLTVEVCDYALNMLRQTLTDAIDGKTGNEAIFALAYSYRTFAKEHKELYRLITDTAVCEAKNNEKLNKSSYNMIQPFLKVLENYNLTTQEKNHWQRILRAIIHGFVTQEEAGFFSHLSENADDSFHIAIICYTDGLTQAEKRKNI